MLLLYPFCRCRMWGLEMLNYLSEASQHLRGVSPEFMFLIIIIHFLLNIINSKRSFVVCFLELRRPCPLLQLDHGWEPVTLLFPQEGFTYLMAVSSCFFQQDLLGPPTDSISSKRLLFLQWKRGNRELSLLIVTKHCAWKEILLPHCENMVKLSP